MVDLNFTLVVQLALFLVFVWAMKRWIYRSLLHVMDEREQHIAEAKEQAQTDQTESARMEQKYAATLAQSYRKANNMVATSLQKKQSALMDDRDRVRREHDEEVFQVRSEVSVMVELERETYPALTHGIAQAMFARLGLRGKAS